MRMFHIKISIQAIKKKCLLYIYQIIANFIVFQNSIFVIPSLYQIVKIIFIIKMSKYKRSFVFQKENQRFYERPTRNNDNQKVYRKQIENHCQNSLAEIKNGVNYQNSHDDTYEQYKSPLVKPFTINMQSTKKLSNFQKRPIQNQQVDYDDQNNYKYDKYDKIQLKEFKQNLRIQHAAKTRQIDDRQTQGNQHKRESSKRIQFQSKINNIQKIGTKIDCLLDYFKNGSRSTILQKEDTQTNYKNLSPYRKLEQNVLNSAKSRSRTPVMRQTQFTPRNRTAIKVQRERLYELSPLNKQKRQSDNFSNYKSPTFDHKKEEAQLKRLLQATSKKRAQTNTYRQIEESEVKQHESNTDLQFYFQSLKKLEKQTKQVRKALRDDKSSRTYNYDYSNYQEAKQLNKNEQRTDSIVRPYSLKYSQRQNIQKSYFNNRTPFITEDQIQLYKDIRIKKMKNSQSIMRQPLSQSQSLSKIQKIKSKYLKDGCQIQEQNQNSYQNQKKIRQTQNQISLYTPTKMTYNFKKQRQSQKSCRQSLIQKNTLFQYRNQQKKDQEQIQKQEDRYKNMGSQNKEIQFHKRVDTGKIDNQIMKIKEKLQESKEQKHILRKKYQQIINEQPQKNPKVNMPYKKPSSDIKKSNSQSKIKYIQKQSYKYNNNVSVNQATAIKSNDRLMDQVRICQRQLRKFEDDERTIVNNTLTQNSYQRKEQQKRQQFKIKLQKVQITKHQITKLAGLLSQQIQIDQKLRNQREKFCLLKNSQKWQRLSDQLQKQGVRLSPQQIQRLLTITSEEHNPFDLPPMVGLNLENEIKSIKNRYLQAQNNYKQNVLSSISKQNLQKQNFSISDIDLSSKGYLSIEDLVCFINLYTGRFYRNRDIIFIVKRLLHNQNMSIQKQESMKIQFQSIIKEFTH